MATLPDQPTPRGSVPPIVYVSEKNVWQYKQMICKLSEGNIPTEDELNQFGRDGWELASVLNHADVLYFYFKRIKP